MLLSLSIMLLRHMYQEFICFHYWVVIHYVCISVYIFILYSTVNPGFHLSLTMEKAASNNFIQIFLQTCFPFPLVHTEEWNCCISVDANILHSRQQCKRALFCYPCTSVTSSLFKFNFFSGCKVT